MQKTLLHNQSLLDFTLHHCGTLQGIVGMAVENNIGITDLRKDGDTGWDKDFSSTACNRTLSFTVGYKFEL